MPATFAFASSLGHISPGHKPNLHAEYGVKTPTSDFVLNVASRLGSTYPVRSCGLAGNDGCIVVAVRLSKGDSAMGLAGAIAVQTRVLR